MSKLPDKIEHIFIDLDGVMVDFHRSLVRLHGFDPDALSDEEWSQWDNYGPTKDPDTFWAPVKEQGEAWWATLPKLPWADELWQAANQACAEVTFLTSPARFPVSASGKYRWVQELYQTRRVLIGKPKEAVAGPNKVLIDDRQSYLSAWERAGGVAVGLRRPWTGRGLYPEELIAALRAHAAGDSGPQITNQRASLPDIDERLLSAAREGAMKAFLTGPSGNRYGAAVLTSSGRIYNAGQYSSFNHVTNVHAEMGAILAATNAGDPVITKLALTSTKDKGKVTRPCGVCRQFILEHAQRTGHEIELIMSDARGLEVDRQPLSAMIPMSWEAQPVQTRAPGLPWSAGVIPAADDRLEFGDMVRYAGNQLALVWVPELWPKHPLVKAKYCAGRPGERDEHGRNLFKYPPSFSSYGSYLSELETRGGALEASPWGDMTTLPERGTLEELMRVAPLNVLPLAELTPLIRLLEEAQLPASNVKVTGSWAVGLGASDSDFDLRVTATPGQIKRLREGVSRALNADVLCAPQDSKTWSSLRFGGMSIEELIAERRFAETFAVRSPRGALRKVSLIYHRPNEGPIFARQPEHRGSVELEGLVRSEGGHLYKPARFSVEGEGEETEVLCLHKLGPLLRAGDKVKLRGELLSDGERSLVLLIDPQRHSLELVSEP